MPEIQQNLVDDLAQATTESWRTLRILAEMVEAFEVLNALRRNCISIFGSARATPETKHYQDAEAIAKLLGQAGYGIITGGGPGIMEAANKGAVEAQTDSVGLHIFLPHEQGCNQYVQTRCNFRYFFLRKLMFIKYSMAYVVMPGGMGTIDELCEAFVLAQTKRIKPFPIILFDSSFWQGLVDWIKGQMVSAEYISAAEVDQLISVRNTPEDVVQAIAKRVIL